MEITVEFLLNNGFKKYGTIYLRGSIVVYYLNPKWFFAHQQTNTYVQTTAHLMKLINKHEMI